MTTSSGAMDDHLRRREVECAATLVDTIVWSVAEGAQVDQGQVLATVGRMEQGNLMHLTAPCRGTVRLAVQPAAVQDAVSADEDSSKTSTAVMAAVEYCIHPLLNGRTCMMCLAIVDENEDDMDGELRSVNVVSHGQVLRLNVDAAKKFDSDNIRRQLGAKKLSLVLDLDHTLLHAVRVSDVVGEIPTTDDTHRFYIPGLVGQEHVVKLRPGLLSFLQDLSQRYDLFIYTHGTRLYAEQIAKIIDPNGSFFQHRIVARTDMPDMRHKSLKLLFPSCDDSMILVLDDRIDVWKENEGNVFLIEPFHFFKCTAEINNAAGTGVLGVEADDAEETEDTNLTHAKTVLMQVHDDFFAGHADGIKGVTAEEQMAGKGRDVKALLAQQKRAILDGCRIVFSGVFPITENRPPESHYLWKLTAELGASPSLTLTNFPLTHLVIHPARLGTQKHNQARAMPNVLVVTPEWVFRCARTWSRAPESGFLAEEWARRRKEAAQAAAEAAAAPPAAAPVVALEPPTPESGVIDGAEANAVAPEVPSPESASLLPDSTAAAEPAVADSSKSTGAADDGKPVLKPAKEKKSVRFDASVDAAEETKTESGAPVRLSGASLVQRRGVVRRPTVNRTGTVRIPENKGVVASGGTFDFLAKISKIAREKPPMEPKPSVPEKKPTPAPKAVAPPKNVDDAFLRLIEAEERENQVEQKRKSESADVKDLLEIRRLKKAKMEAEATANAKHEQEEEDNDDEDDDGDLDDLEADILGDF